MRAEHPALRGEATVPHAVQDVHGGRLFTTLNGRLLGVGAMALGKRNLRGLASEDRGDFSNELKRVVKVNLLHTSRI